MFLYDLSLKIRFEGKNFTCSTQMAHRLVEARGDYSSLLNSVTELFPKDENS